MAIPKLSFDIDGVLADFTGPFTRLLNKHGNTNYPKDWPTYNCYGDGEWFSRKAWDLAWKEQQNTPAFWYNLDTLNGVDLKSINNLMIKKMFHGYFVTRRTDTAPGVMLYPTTNGIGSIVSGDVTLQTRLWLNKKGITDSAGVIAGSFDRAQLLNCIRVGAHLDDWGEQYLQLRDAGINCYLIDRTHNQYIGDIGERRVYSVQEYIMKALANSSDNLVAQSAQ